MEFVMVLNCASVERFKAASEGSPGRRKRGQPPRVVQPARRQAARRTRMGFIVKIENPWQWFGGAFSK